MFNKILILILLFFSTKIFSQWDIGISYNIRNEIPETGIGLQIEKKLPLQFPDFGGKLRFQADFFNSTISSVENNALNNRNYFNSEYQLSIIFEYFFRYFYPYVGFGAGFGNLVFRDNNQTSFLLNGFAGIELNLSDNVNPFAEAHFLKYFASFSPEEFERSISSFTVKGVFGLRFNLSVID